MRTIRLRAGAVVLCAIALACNDPAPSGAGSPAGADDAPERVVGLIINVEPEDGIPTAFTVEEEDGDTFTIAIDPDLDYGFDLLHVREHFVTEDPVDVSVRAADGDLVATSISDVE